MLYGVRYGEITRSVACKGNICALAGFKWRGEYAKLVLIDANNDGCLSIEMVEFR